VRQFVEGKRFFREEFGVEPTEVWLPDSFGYSGALPQIARDSGARYLLTQKLSWNEVDRFPHHSFDWEGIDGTRIFTHFPPVDTYSSTLSAAELAHAEANFADKGRANMSLVPFGYGDGGGGPTRELVAAARRAADLEGSPTVRIAPPSEFFAAAAAELTASGAVPVWVGELYLEFHRGTYTSQARTKRGNRRSEQLLHEAELWATTAAVRAGTPYPVDALREAWRTVLLQQFHDVLPGSSIGWVHDEAERNYAHVAHALERIIARSLEALTQGTAGRDVSGRHGVVFNASPFPVDGVPAFGAAPPRVVADAHLSRAGAGFVLGNASVSVTIDGDGLIASIVDRARDRELIPPGTRGNLLQLFRDTPAEWDAWNIDAADRRSGQDLVALESLEIVADSPERAAVRLTRRFGSSAVTQTISVHGGSRAVEIETTVDWHERQRMLKLALPVDVHAASARSEIQFGHIERPTHTNTSWDLARFETAAHRWVHVADASFGVAVANDSTYGHDITRHPRAGGGTYSLVRQSLLRAPVFPDPDADQGEHTFRTAIVAGDVGAAIETGYGLNRSLRPPAGTAADAGAAVEPLVSSSDPAVVIETVKLAEDGSGDVIVRLYEARGGRASTRIRAAFPFGRVTPADLLERPVPADAITASDATGASLALRPFQLVTLRFERIPELG
ncbi:MAG TPA: glycoside hydrolase family 38 C-terminal domain-containing protein, partial [Leifsonia sp.]